MARGTTARASRGLHAAGKRTLCIDIGGTGLKAMILNADGKPQTARVRVDTPRPATPDAILRALAGLVGPLGKFDRVSVGFPGVVVDGLTKTAPNLHKDWVGYPLAEALTASTRCPVRVLNDAGVQGYGVVEGRGTELLLTLGTGMGCAVFVEGRYVPNVELGHHPLRKGKTYEELVSDAAFEELGKKRWNKNVARALAASQALFNPRMTYLGGGNSRHVHLDLPASVKIVDNVAGLLGGLALWHDPPHDPEPDSR